MTDRNAAKSRRIVVFNSVGNVVTRWDLDIDTATLQPSGSVTLPSVVQYGWPHPSNRYLYLTCTDSERGSKTITGAGHYLVALQTTSGGELSFHGEPRKLRQRAIHNSVDRDGRYVLACYNAPSHVSVHALLPDGRLGEEVPQQAALDLGVFCHQIQATSSNEAVLMVTRGHNPKPGKPDGEPGALKMLDFAQGRLSSRQSIAAFGRDGAGYGPRHAAFHPTRPWVYVLVELQHQLHMHLMMDDRLAPEPSFMLPSTQYPPVPGVVQVGGAIHVHPRGHVLYATNRVSATTNPIGPFHFEAGENNIAVFSIDPFTGEPKPIQFADPHGFHVRAFTIDPTGTLLIAATLAAMAVGEGEARQIVPAGLCIFRIAGNGTLSFVRRYDIELGPGVQHMWVRALELPDE
jgi:6-phosphogluconolactonase